jgi:hypothetical protein
MTEDDNPVEDNPGAVLIADDPTGETAVRFVWVADLSSDDYERYSKAVTALADIRSSNMFGYVRQAGLALMREYGEAMKAMYENRISHVQMDDIEEWCARLRTAILGLCSSICQHQEQCLIEVKRRFGDGSLEQQEMKKVFNSLFDNCFGYRYLYKMRNAMVHYSMFAASIGAESHRHEDQDIHWFDLKLNRSILLEQRSFLNARLTRELEELADDPELIPMMNEAFLAMQKANRRIVEILHPNIAEICFTVVEFDNLFGNRDGVRAISRTRSRELRRPFNFGYHPVAGQSIMAARNFVREAACAAGIETTTPAGAQE